MHLFCNPTRKANVKNVHVNTKIMKTRKFITSLFLVAAALIFSQKTVSANDSQRAKQAVRLFVNKQYAAAMPMFAQLVANHPENYKYNYYYGVCLLVCDKDKVKAVEHLEISLKNPKAPEEVYYYLARAYHMNYMFDEGIRSIAEFSKIIKPKYLYKYKTSDVTEALYCAKRTLDSSRNNTVLESTLSTPGDFFSKYAFEGNYGKILSMPEEYVNKKDDGESPTIFLSANGNVMYYAAYSSETNSRDIYRVTKSTDGSWNKPERLDNVVNSNKDEMYPTCTSDGSVLYFSSMGHKSTGGFDIYKSVYSRAESKWSDPENMGSPYNSPFDDFNYMPSAPDKIAYFTSTRGCDMGQFMVCKSTYNSGEEIPIELKGKFACINSPEIKSARITVTRNENDSVIATLNTDAATGSYNLMLPGAGKYNFKVEVDGYQPHTQVATFSEFGEAYFIQQIYLSRDPSGAEDVAINNLTEAEMERIQSNLVAMEDEMGTGC
jgi:tetratricopeptide (TPR) repeat protein